MKTNIGVLQFLLVHVSVQVLDAPQLVPYPCHVHGSVHIIVLLPHVRPNVHQELQAVQVAVLRWEVQRRVASVVWLVRVSPVCGVSLLNKNGNRRCLKYFVPRTQRTSKSITKFLKRKFKWLVFFFARKHVTKFLEISFLVKL